MGDRLALRLMITAFVPAQHLLYTHRYSFDQICDWCMHDSALCLPSGVVYHQLRASLQHIGHAVFWMTDVVPMAYLLDRAGSYEGA